MGGWFDGKFLGRWEVRFFVVETNGGDFVCCIGSVSAYYIVP